MRPDQLLTGGGSNIGDQFRTVLVISSGFPVYMFGLVVLPRPTPDHLYQQDQGRARLLDGVTAVGQSATRPTRPRWQGRVEVKERAMTLIVNSLDAPDETLSLPGGARVELVRVGSVTVGRGTARPGWAWSRHVKPTAGTEWCEISHVGGKAVRTWVRRG